MIKNIVGKVKVQQDNWKGWLVGQFIPDGPFKDNSVEIFYKKIKPGEFIDKLHLHPVGNEYMIVISGRIIMKIGEEVIELTEGDYVKIPSNTPDKIIEILEETVIAGVRTPSVPNNKTFLE